MQIRAGDSLKRFRVSNDQQVVQTDVRGNQDICREVEVDWQWQEFAPCVPGANR
jgi:hypothetical protein